MRLMIVPSGLAVGVLVAGCGGSGAAEPAATGAAASVPPAAASATPVPAASATTGADDALRAAVQAYSDAFLTGDAEKAYDLLSERCRKRTSPAEFTAIAGAAGQMYGSALPLETYSAEVSGDLARVTYTYSIKAIDQEAEPWTREGGAWHQDDC